MSTIGSNPSLPRIQQNAVVDTPARARSGDAAAPPAREGGLGNITGKTATRTGGGLGHKHTTWGSAGGGFSLGKTLASIIRLPGRGLRELGNLIQGENKSGARYVGGALVKGLGNIVGAAAGLVGGTVTFAESVVSNLGGFALRMAGAAVLGTLSAIGTLVTGGQSKTTIEGLKLARDLVVDTPMFDRFRGQEALTPADAKKHLWDAQFAEGSPPGKHKDVTEDDLPAGVAKNWTVDDQTHVVGGALNLKGSGLLGTYTNVSLAWDTTDAKPGEKGTLVVRFGGTNNARHALTDLQQALGVPDGAYREAKDLVAQLAKAHPGQVRVIGHSMGGGLAQYAGIAAGVPVTSFNGVGLHPHLRDKLGFDAIEHSNVTHINTSGDPLAKYAALDMSSQQIGRRIEIQGGGHGMKHIQEQMTALARTA